MRIERRALPPHQLPDTLPPLLQRLYATRGLTDPGQLAQRLTDLPSAKGMRGADAAAEVIGSAVLAQRRIVIAGDYDADGATAVSVAVLGLRQLGARAVSYVVPDRFSMGYGLSPALVDCAREQGAELLITVDCGIASLTGAEHARAVGLALVVTDHHLPGPELPVCAAIVNPNQPGCEFPSRNLAGVGVMFYLLTRVRAWLAARQAYTSAPPPLADLLDLVAIGTVADLVRLDAVNRVLVAQGLARLRAGRGRPGVRALLHCAGRTGERLTATDLGFVLGPRINAAGRLDNIRTGIDCLLAEDDAEAQRLAAELERINRERRELTARMSEEADRLVGTTASDAAGLCVFDPHWHEGIVGLVASRLKERLHRPTIALARAQDPGWLKGSARSIAGLHLRDALAAVDAQHPGLIERYGGHASAAGLSIRESGFPALRAAFGAQCARQLSAEDLYLRIDTDGALAADEFTVTSARLIEDGGPWGQGFPEPCFDGEFQVLEARPVGADQNHVKYRLRGPGSAALSAIDFGGAPRICGRGRVHAVYALGVNRWQGRETLDLRLRWLAPA